MNKLTKRLNYFFVLILLLSSQVGKAQLLTLKQSIEKAQENYPVLKQKQIIEQTKSLTVSNLNSGYLPQLSLNGQATYQTEVTQMNIPIPNFKANPLSKDQYKVVAEMSQLLYDGGAIKQQKELQRLSATTETQKAEVEIYKLKERITQYYLNILLIEEQLKQTEFVKSDINNGIKKVQAQVDNGVAFKSNVNTLKAQLLQTTQKQIELQATRKGLIDVLSTLMQQPISYETQFEKPALASFDEKINRPELSVLDSQNAWIAQQNKLINSKNLPKASLFVQGGYGKPGLNMLKNEFDTYAIGGIRFNWNLSNLYTLQKEKQIVLLNQQNIATQKENLLLNIDAQVKQQLSDIEKTNALIKTDEEIIDLRNGIKKAAHAQLENGVITTNDYLREVNAEDLARQTLITHKIQLLQSQLNLQLIKGQF